MVILRYFNPGGAHATGILAENPKQVPNNLIPYITRVATGEIPHLKIFGNDYATRDGTGVRDYLHVMDLSEGHLAAILAFHNGFTGAECFNLGTGVGVSVLEMVNAFANTLGANIPCEIHARRARDVAECYADPSKAQQRLGWKARCTLHEICRDALASAHTHT